MRGKLIPSPYPRGILRKQEKSGSSKAPGDNKEGPYARKKETHLIHEKMDNVPPLTGKDVEDPMGLFSTELKVYKVRGAKTVNEQRKRGK